jgi:hypothetical protein
VLEEEERLKVFHLQLVYQEVQVVELRLVEQLDQEFLVKVIQVEQVLIEAEEVVDIMLLDQQGVLVVELELQVEQEQILVLIFQVHQFQTVEFMVEVVEVEQQLDQMLVELVELVVEELVEIFQVLLLQELMLV